MRLPLILLLSLTGCVDRSKSDGDGSASETGTSEVDPTAPMTDPTADPTAEPTTGELDNPAGFCSPVESDPGQCPADYTCCSDDPATTLARLPNYFSGQVDDKYGVPIFSSNNNLLSYSGQCVLTGAFPSPFANGCPVPCDPTWAEPDRQEICGAGAVCCPFRQVDPEKDCVIDPDTSKWRAVHGTDIPKLTSWGMQHTTNQDPNGSSCTLFASGGGGVDTAALTDCYEQLSVADRRGFCFADCPCFEDLCDQKNPGWMPRCK